MTETQLKKLDQKLQELAIENFVYFCEITGVNKRKALACLERDNGKSYQQIAIKLNEPVSTVKSMVKKCKRAV